MGFSKGKKRKTAGGSQVRTGKRKQEFGSLECEDHRVRRKLLRKEERRKNKRIKKMKIKAIKAGKKVSEEALVAHSEVPDAVEHKSRESFKRKQDLRNKLQLEQLKRAIETEEDKITSWTPPKPKDERPKEKKLKLKGAARPAEEVYPHLYPPKETERVQTEDLLEKFEGKLTSHVETFEYVRLSLLLGVSLLSQGKSDEAIEVFESVSKMDQEKQFFNEIIQEVLVAAFIESGDLLKARTVIENYNKDDQNVFLLWDKVLIEYISCHVLNEEEKDDAFKESFAKALKASDEIPEVLICHEEFEADISPESITEDIRTSLSYYLDDCFRALTEQNENTNKPERTFTTSLSSRYFHRSISWWRDAEGIFDHISELLPEEAAEK